jgi:NADH:ubiquinone oxidoreductase subunit 6 (subunit J)
VGSVDRSSFPLPWMAADVASRAFELLAVIGVIIWAGALACLVVTDCLHARSRHHEHHGQPGRSAGIHHHAR